MIGNLNLHNGTFTLVQEESALAFPQPCPCIQGEEPTDQVTCSPVAMEPMPLHLGITLHAPGSQNSLPPMPRWSPLPDPTLAASLVYPPKSKLGCQYAPLGLKDGQGGDCKRVVCKRKILRQTLVKNSKINFIQVSVIEERDFV